MNKTKTNEIVIDKVDGLPFGKRYHIVKYYFDHKDRLTKTDICKQFGITIAVLDSLEKEVDQSSAHQSPGWFSNRLGVYTSIPKNELEDAYNLGRKEGKQEAQKEYDFELKGLRKNYQEKLDLLLDCLQPALKQLLIQQAQRNQMSSWHTLFGGSTF